MLKLEITNEVLNGGSKVFFKGAALELLRYEGQELQVNTFLYFEKDGIKSQFVTYNHCDVEKNTSLDKRIISEDVEQYTFPEENRKNQIIYYTPAQGSKVTIEKLTNYKNQQYFDGAFEGETVYGCEYFGFLDPQTDNQDNAYMVLLSTKNLNVLLRPAFLKTFGIDVQNQKDTALFEKVFALGNNLTVLGSYLGIVKISDIYATDTYTYLEYDGQRYEYHCLEKFDECKDEVIRNTRFFRQCNLKKVQEFTVPADSEYVMVDYYLPVDEGNVTLKPLTSEHYGKYVPFADAQVEVSGCRYFAVTMRNSVEKDSEKVLYTIVENYKKTRYKKFSRLMSQQEA